MTEPRLIKKYPNRRLYDTQLSKYIALDDLRKLLVSGTRVKVVDKKSGEDITRSILLQIIVEQEEKGQPILTTELLEKIIQYYGDTLQMFVSDYLEKSMETFGLQQDDFRKQMETMMKQTPMDVYSEIAEKNLTLWKEMQDNLTRLYTSPFSDRKRDEED
jgi:polyhydroxyalkanoate synthesis repressor PhaR